MFAPATEAWFTEALGKPTLAQQRAWPSISAGESTLLLAPTGSGKTLAAFLAALDRLIFGQPPAKKAPAEAPSTKAPAKAPGGVRVLYISPLKALGVDVERNLRAPLSGIRAVAAREGLTAREPSVGVRSGDTPSSERARLARRPPEILITTPESLYLMLTSAARSTLTGVETVIIDEIHAVAGTKRGAHLFLSLERLERLRVEAAAARDAPVRPLQRIGLSATQRPLEEIARLLGGFAPAAEGAPPDAARQPRPVTVIDASAPRPMELAVEVPVADMTDLSEIDAGVPQDGAAVTMGMTAEPTRQSIWPAIHPRLVEMIRAHRSTMIFVNSRRLAERLVAAINEVASESAEADNHEAPLARAHHGSIARDVRLEIEEQLKAGQLPAIVATSSLELGIDIGAVELVVMVEAPPSVASGLQRIGRSGHHVGGTSRGVVLPKYRGDLLACAAVAHGMRDGLVESTRYPRNPLDVLAQQLVAMVSIGEPCDVDALFALVRGAAPFAELPRGAFEATLDMLSGRYPDDRFAGLRPRLTWDRVDSQLTARRGAKRIAVTSGGTIPDRGNYGVYLAGQEDVGAKAGSGGGSTANRNKGRLGELDEEMVFEANTGDVIVLGASTWRIVEIDHDRVLVEPAPGEPGKMPFWHGDRLGRPLELGERLGALTRQLGEDSGEQASERLTALGLDRYASDNLIAYVKEQREAACLPTDQTIVVERFLDEVGDWRVAILSPFGGRVHAPWAIAVAGRLRLEAGYEVDRMWTDDGLVFRLAASDGPPDPALFLPTAEEIEPLLTAQLGETSLFAARFRENAARALLLPRRMPGKRTPLWVQRRRSSELLQIAAGFRDFPIVLETYRECLQDGFDLDGLRELLGRVERGRVRVELIDSSTPSPFAAALLFSYVASYIYEGDAPLAERRAQALSLDTGALRELLGSDDLRELLQAEAVEEVGRSLQRLDGRRPLRSADDVHDLLLETGPQREADLAARLAPEASPAALASWIEALRNTRRIIKVHLAGASQLAAAEDAGRLRDAFGVMPPPGLPAAFLEADDRALLWAVSRFARTHGPFTTAECAETLGLGVAPTLAALEALAAEGRVLVGRFRGGVSGSEWCEPEVLRRIKRRSLAALRDQIEPVDEHTYASFLLDWHGIVRPRRGLDGLLDVVEQLEGAPLIASELESSILPARVSDYQPAMLDELLAAGEICWQGRGMLGPTDGRVCLFLADHALQLGAELGAELESPAPDAESDPFGLLERLATGAFFFEQLLPANAQEPGPLGLPAGAIDPAEVLSALWELVWAGLVSNDTLAPLRTLLGRPGGGRKHPRRRYRSRRRQLPGSAGRWSLTSSGRASLAAARAHAEAGDGPGAAGKGPGTDASPAIAASAPPPGRHQPTTAADRQRLAAAWAGRAAKLLERHGVVTREIAKLERLEGGWARLYPIYRQLEETARARRGYFVAGLGAAQFALPGAETRLRQDRPDQLVRALAATDPASPWGAQLPWPEREGEGTPRRAAGARVLLAGGDLLGWLAPTGRALLTFPSADPSRQPQRDRHLCQLLAAHAPTGKGHRLQTIDGLPAHEAPLAAILRAAGYRADHKGLVLAPRRR